MISSAEPLPTTAELASAFRIMGKLTQRTNPSWRHGQALFNICYVLAPGLADKLRATADDPFHDDSRCDRFAHRMAELTLGWVRE